MPVFKRFIVGSDNHGELGCPEAIKTFLDFSKDWKPHHKIHLGDVWDYGILRNGASQEDKSHGIMDDYVKGMEFLEEYRPNMLCLGNHDDRVWQKTENCMDGALKERCRELAIASERRFSQLKIKWCPYVVDSYLQMPEGGPKLIHGFRSTMYPAKANFDNWGPSISGHVHKPDEYTARHIDGEQAFTVGALADLKKMKYADRHPAKLGWRQGFLYGYINVKTGKWNAWNITKEDGHWLSPQGPL